MRNKENAFRKIEKVEGLLKVIEVLMTRENQFEEIISRIKLGTELLEEIKSIIDKEPNEFN